MSNRVVIQPTVFVNKPQNDETYGVRVYDDYDQSYVNTWESIPEDDVEVLRKLVEENLDETIGAMLDFVIGNETGIYIGENWYIWDDIKQIMSPE
jgi:hypothetical protein